jgi:hypothetical protein
LGLKEREKVKERKREREKEEKREGICVHIFSPVRRN